MEVLAEIARVKGLVANNLLAHRTAQKENWIVQGVMAEKRFCRQKSKCTD